MHLLNEIYVDDTLVVYDHMRLEPTKHSVHAIGYMENYSHLGSCYFIHPEVNQNS